MCDNTSAINILKNLIQHSRTKHIDIKHNFIHDHVLKGDIELEFIFTSEQLADILTKPFDKETFISIRQRLGMCDLNEF